MFNIYQRGIPLFCPWIGPTLLSLRSRPTITAFLRYRFVKEMIVISLQPHSHPSLCDWTAIIRESSLSRPVWNVRNDQFNHSENIRPWIQCRLISPFCSHRLNLIIWTSFQHIHESCSTPLTNPKWLSSLLISEMIRKWFCLHSICWNYEHCAVCMWICF